ncbi:ketoacyl-ACP synthase III [Castellaniella sp.]|uniref:3-oxoacyl-ACP synthase III family protein n=1 Tax=Castellaniella sp. TaxID=1955812 RepID=UPI002AFF3F8D|nr:ketoacyl-ACP synthase III [Castellaniella sp.]
MPDVYLNAIASVQGSIRQRNDASTLSMPGSQCERLVNKIGISERPVVGPSQYTSDLALDSIHKLLIENPWLTTEDIGALIVCTQTPDHLIPGVSSLLHGRLRLPTDCFVLDINQGCSGFVLGTQMITALQKVQAKGKSTILVNADTYTRLLQPDDLTTRVLFGDGATATVFSSHVPRGLRIIYSHSYADGSGYDAFVAHGSALRPNGEQAAGIQMDGPAILNFALRVVPDAIQRALVDTSLQIEEIKTVAFHQANHFVTSQLSRKLKLTPAQAPENCAQMGNLVSASIPTLLADQMPEFKPGDKVMTVGFGVGLSWGVSIFEYALDES